MSESLLCSSYADCVCVYISRHPVAIIVTLTPTVQSLNLPLSAPVTGSDPSVSAPLSDSRCSRRSQSLEGPDPQSERPRWLHLAARGGRVLDVAEVRGLGRVDT